jgi:hypothetical protein
MYSVLDLKNDLSGILHGTTNNQIQNLDGVINRAARDVLLDVDPQETKRQVEFVAPIFNSVFDYPIAADVKGNKIIDIYPQVQRIPQDIWTQAYNQAFDVAKQNIFSMANMFTINFNTSLKTIRINAPFLNPPVIINQIEAIATNGTWAAGGTATNLAVNNTNFAQGAGSLQFDVTSGAAYIENSTMTAVNLSTIANQASLFTWVYIPTAASLTSVDLRFGSDASNYYHRTVTATQQGTAFVNGWNLCQFQWAGATQVGTPNTAAIAYGRVTLNVTGSMTGCLVNGMDAILGTILSYEYYSKYLFRNASTGAYQETVLDDGDLINLDTESYDLLTYKVAALAVQQQQGLDASFYDGPFFEQKYQAMLLRYKAMYKSELQKPQSAYYNQPDTSYNRFNGRGWG